MRDQEIPNAIPRVRVLDGRSARTPRFKRRYARTSVVYFIRGGSRFKIGTTDRIGQRFDALQSASPSPLKLVGVIYGGESVERWCQYHCIDHRSHLEWFRWNRWTDGFVNWVLGHGCYAADLLCLFRSAKDRGCDPLRWMPALPALRDEGRQERLRDYRERAAKVAEPLGACPCTVCRGRPWERWSRGISDGGQLGLFRLEQPSSELSTMASTSGRPCPKQSGLAKLDARGFGSGDRVPTAQGGESLYALWRPSCGGLIAVPRAPR